MKAQLTLEAILLYSISLVTTVIVLGSILYINDQVKYAIEKGYRLKEKVLVIDIINELCVLGNGVRYKIKLKYDHKIDQSSVICDVEGEIREGEVIFRNVMGKVYVSPI